MLLLLQTSQLKAFITEKGPLVPADPSCSRTRLQPERLEASWAASRPGAGGPTSPLRNHGAGGSRRVRSPCPARWAAGSPFA